MRGASLGIPGRGATECFRSPQNYAGWRSQVPICRLFLDGDYAVAVDPRRKEARNGPRGDSARILEQHYPQCTEEGKQTSYV